MRSTKKHIALVIAFVMALTVVPAIVFADDVSAASSGLKRPKLTNHAASSTSIKNTWSKVKGAKGYEVYRATKQKGKYKKVKTIKSGKTVAWTNKNLKKNKNYFFKVRAYKTVKGKKKYSKFSSVRWAVPTNSPAMEYSMSGKTKTTSTVSVSITNKGRYTMTFDPWAIYLANPSALKTWENLTYEELENMTEPLLNQKGITGAKGKSVKIKPGKTAKLSYGTYIDNKRVKVKYTKDGYIENYFTFNKKQYGAFSSYKHGGDYWQY